MIIGGSESGKTNTLFHLINEQDNIDKIYLHGKDLSKPKHEFLFKKRKNTGIQHLNDLSAFIECLNTTDDIYTNIDHYNPSRKRKNLLYLMTRLQTLWQTKNFNQ